MENNPLNVGIIGCGNISPTYMELPHLFADICVIACADANPDAARQRAEEYDLQALSVSQLLASPDIDIVVNLTVPTSHYQVSQSILDAGKHVYTEKPFALSVAEGQELIDRAAQNGVRIGSAPDTFLGGSHQQARHLIDSGAIGKVVTGSAHIMSRGMEHWHPDPDFFFRPGAGPVFDLGPYYITNLVQLIGPVRRIMAMSSIPFANRTITSQPRFGEKIPVETPTTIHSLLEFECGALITLSASWDVWHHGHNPMELYGAEGSLLVPDPNYFGGDTQLYERATERELADFGHPFGIANLEEGNVPRANYRAAGLADMARSIRDATPHRCSAETALHVVDVMASILKSGETGQPVNLSTSCNRPEALNASQARSLLK